MQNISKKPNKQFFISSPNRGGVRIALVGYYFIRCITLILEKKHPEYSFSS